MAGVTIKPAPHCASSIRKSYLKHHSAVDILKEVRGENPNSSAAYTRERTALTEVARCNQLIASSFEGGKAHPVHPSPNGFLYAAIEAYSSHHHLKIRPEDVWLSILTQLSSYINAHAEELRGSFVAHEGKKELTIENDFGTRFTNDWADFASRIGALIEKNVVDPELREWMMPAFSTTTEHDKVVANIVMMASMQAYFDYHCNIMCGLPSVTLLGEKADYELILHKLDKLRLSGEEGKEPTEFAELLIPVIKRFIKSFEAPESEEVRDFWNHI